MKRFGIIIFFIAVVAVCAVYINAHFNETQWITLAPVPASDAVMNAPTPSPEAQTDKEAPYSLSPQMLKTELTEGLIAALNEFQEVAEIRFSEPVMPQGEKESFIQNALGDAFSTLRREHPEIFWIGNDAYSSEWWGNGDTLTSTRIRLNYSMTEQEARRSELDIEVVVSNLLSEAPSDPYEALVYFHDWICKNTQYDYGVANTGTTKGHEEVTNSTGVFLENRAVCEGYAKAFKLLCDRVGIPCVVVLGTTDGEGHAWNYVNLEGAWYLVDCTMDDQKPISYQYFLRGSDVPLKSSTVGEWYQEDGQEYPVLSESDFRKPLR